MKTSLDMLLSDRSDKFKSDVLELAIKNNWDENDPAFTILIATGQLEVLLKQYPTEFAVLLTGILESTEQRWAVLHSKNREHIDKVEAATTHQIQRMETEYKRLLSEGFLLAQNEVRKTMKSSQKIEIMKASGVLILAIVAMVTLSWISGWFSREWLERSRDRSSQTSMIYSSEPRSPSTLPPLPWYRHQNDNLLLHLQPHRLDSDGVLRASRYQSHHIVQR
jgi:hypothetical protein